MQAIRLSLALCVPFALLACAGDNPANPPERGEWEMVAEIDSVTIDGRIFPTEQLPPQFQSLQNTKRQCGEPMFVDPDWQQDDLADRTGGQCSFDRYDHTDTGASGAGTCRLEGSGTEYNPRFETDVSFGSDSYRTVIRMNGSMTVPQDGSTHTVRIIAVQEGTRLGDC